SRLPRNRRLTAERPNSLNPRQCEISGLELARSVATFPFRRASWRAALPPHALSAPAHPPPLLAAPARKFAHGPHGPGPWQSPKLAPCSCEAGREARQGWLALADAQTAHSRGGWKQASRS